MKSAILSLAALLLGCITACGSSDKGVESVSGEETVIAPAIPDTVASPVTANLHNPLPSLPKPLLLAGNFAELRQNHFHSGVDFKTGGRTGVKVVAADSGYVSRILVSPWGFGRAVYIDHPRTGLTTVYGHLESFAPAIDKEAKSIQYEKETFSIDVSFPPGKIPVKRGEVIGLSGNAGSSGGPHLHMDVRHTASEDPVDPMPYFRHLLKDDVAPEMRKLSLFAIPGEGVVTSPASFMPGKSPYKFTAWGKVYPGIKAYDRMSGTQNIYGVKYLSLIVDGDTVYHRTLDRFSFDTTRAVHTLIHNPSMKKNGEWIMTTRVPAANHLESNIWHTGQGVIIVDQPREYACKFILEDDFGNKTVVPFKIEGKEMSIPQDDRQQNVYPHDRRIDISSEGIDISLPAFARYDDLPLNISSVKAPEYNSDIYTIGDFTEALHYPMNIRINISKDTIRDKNKYTLVRLSEKNKGRTAVTSSYEDGAINAKVSNFGRYAVTTDTTTPTIKKLQAPAGKLIYRISDNLSGVEDYRVEIDGKFALFELDGKTGNISYAIDFKRFPKTGKRHNVKVVVKDAAGNVATLSDSIVF